MIDAKPLVERVLDDEGLTAGLEDPEARLLVEWLVERAERIAQKVESKDEARQELEQLCRYARALRRFLVLWCYECNSGAAAQLAASERFPWPLPPSNETSPLAILQSVLYWHDQNESTSGDNQGKVLGRGVKT